MRRLTRIDRLIETIVLTRQKTRTWLFLIEVKRGIRAILQASCAVSVTRTVLVEKGTKLAFTDRKKWDYNKV